MPRSSTRVWSRWRACARTMASFSPSRYAAARRTPYVYTVIGPSSSNLGYMRPHTHHVENHDHHADGDRGVRDVERPEVIRPPVDVDEVHHRSRRDPIEQVACGAADDQREPDARRELVMAEVRQVHADRNERRRRDGGNDHDLEREVGRVEKAERGAGIA